MDQQEMTLKEAAEWSGYAEVTIRGFVAKGKLNATKRGRRLWVTPAEMTRFLQEHDREKLASWAERATYANPPGRIIDERDVEKRLADACRRRGWLCWKFTSPGKNGVPDRIVIRPRGYAAPAFVDFVEVKSPTGRLRPSQVALHRKMREVGAQVVVVHNFREVDEAVKRWEKECADRGDCWVASLS